MKAIDYFTPEQRERIKHAVHHAEMLTSGELRVYIEDKCKGDVLDRAAFVFAEMLMHKTKDRNGVLIYLALQDHKFAIIGDAGINIKVGDDFWNKIKADMQAHFKESRFTDGLVQGIMEAGNALQQHFPRAHDDSNELSNDIVFGKDQ